VTLIAPLLPQLGVTNVSRSHKFYCQVLGFTSNWEHEENGAMVVTELQLGATKLQIAAHDGVRDNSEQRSARRATLLFFETDDVAGLRESVLAHGGRPSELKIVDYWMRMQIFTIYDPDDYALWFGQQVRT
jgi:predicted enzyme related to lactoylglutathione lyase